ncbi:GLPGLI family protein [Chitinophaga sancti]|uniref:GLPGLI family protein n=1 Tax=Chitinophaga sancti TaxID=1004 RepID=UPI002A74EB9D|nr:GLPGLI family protein [Chitinophaga sancti]WPQ64188.1 GLPGLI family protein [Chitinophaga sancti]
MNHLSKTLFGAALIAFTGFTAQAQEKNSGVIDYELSQKMPPRGGDGGDEEGQVITIKQHFFFAAGHGKLETERPNFGGGMDRQGPPPPGEGGEQGPPPGFGGGRFRGGFGMMGGGFVDLQSHKYLQTFTKPDDSTKTYFAEEDFRPAKDVKPGDKTKKIAGYNCKKATVTVRDETYTVWYTTDLPFSYSPVNGLLPEPNGVVLAAESDNRSFTAKKVDFKPIPPEKVSLPGNAEKVSEEEMHKMRQEARDKFRDRQNRN